MFGSTRTNRPFGASYLQKAYLHAAGERAGIPALGWHSFRHTYRALGRKAGASLEEQKFLMRHASLQQTSEYGNEGIDRAELVREPNSRIVTMLKRRA